MAIYAKRMLPNTRANNVIPGKAILSYLTKTKLPKSSHNAQRDYKPKSKPNFLITIHSNHETNQSSQYHCRGSQPAQNLPSVISFMISLIIGLPFMIARSLIPIRLGLCFPPTVPFLGLFWLCWLPTFSFP